MIGSNLDRRDKSGGHIVIAGTGRAGTTLLVQILTHLGFDTGYSLDEAMRKVDPVAHAGLEQSIAAEALPDWPYVVKSPRLSVRLGSLLRERQIRIRAVIVPLRAMEDAAASRERIAAAGGARGASWRRRPGQSQHEALLEVSHALMLTIAQFSLPHVLVQFPRFARRARYAWLQLAPVLQPHGVTFEEFEAAHAACVRLDRIHDFGAGRLPPGAAAAVADPG